MNIVWLALAGWGGGLVSGLLGWFESKEPFDGRKFGATFVRALLAGAVFAVGGHLSGILPTWEIMIAGFLAGAGVDAGLHRLAGSVR